MRRFTDRQARVWQIDVNVASIKRVRALLGIDLYRLIDDGLKPLAELLADPVRLVDVVYALAEDQARAAGVSDEDFGRAMAGDAIQEAAEAFVEELFDFFPETRDRLTLRKVMGKQKEVAQAIADERDLVIDTMVPADEARRIVRVRLPRSSSGAAPASSESTPEAGPLPS